MVSPRREAPAFLSSSVVAQMFGMKQSTLRAQIDLGVFPEPDWIRVGEHVERIYSLEWVSLAAEELNSRLLPGFDELVVPPEGAQVTLRLNKETWDVTEAISALEGIRALWAACVGAVEHSGERADAPLTIRRMSAGSPLDVLLWVRDAAGLVLGVGGAASLFRYALKHPESIVEALPRMAASWQSGWARVDDAKLDRLQSRANLERFKAEAERARQGLEGLPVEVTASGIDVANLETVAPRPALSDADEDEGIFEIRRDESHGAIGAADDSNDDDPKIGQATLGGE